MFEPLPPAWVDRLFGRLAIRYGQDWIRLWEGLDLAAVKVDWGQVLAGMHRPEREHALRYGIENLPPDRPPTAAQFKAICNRAPEYVKPIALPAPVVNPEGIARLRSMLTDVGRPKDPRAWAHRLKERHQRGERLTLAQIDMYRSALAAKPGEMSTSSMEAT
jgi:hypothetical protein